MQCYDLGQRGYERKVQSMLVVYVERLLHRFFLPIVMMILLMAMIFLEFQTIRFSLSKKKEKDDSSSFPSLVPFVPICIYAFSFGIHVEIFILYFYWLIYCINFLLQPMTIVWKQGLTRTNRIKSPLTAMVILTARSHTIVSLRKDHRMKQLRKRTKKFLMISY